MLALAGALVAAVTGAGGGDSALTPRVDAPMTLVHNVSQPNRVSQPGEGVGPSPRPVLALLRDYLHAPL